VYTFVLRELSCLACDLQSTFLSAASFVSWAEWVWFARWWLVYIGSAQCKTLSSVSDAVSLCHWVTYC